MSTKKYTSQELPDVAHNSTPAVLLPIQKVGVRNVTAPLRIRVRQPKSSLSRFKRTLLSFISKDSSYMTEMESHQVVTADISMYVSLQPETKGISMSPLTFTLKNKLDKVFTYNVVDEILQEIKHKTEVEAIDSYFKAYFRFAKEKKSPYTDNSFPEFYNCELEGKSVGDNLSQFFLTVEVPYMSYCPCSARLAKHLMEEEGEQGYPHAQRSTVRATIELTRGVEKTFYIEDLIDLLEGAINYCIPYPIIRRPDERELTRIAGKTTIFCEDAARMFGKALEDDSRIRDYVVVCNHYESIHTSEAVSVMWKNIPNGLR